jgi:hypothetical protein
VDDTGLHHCGKEQECSILGKHFTNASSLTKSKNQQSEVANYKKQVLNNLKSAI